MALEGRARENLRTRPSNPFEEKVATMSAEPSVAEELFCVGTVCRSRNSIIKTADEESARLCKIVGIVRQEYWRRADMPEYRVRMLAFPITAVRRANELQMVSPQ
jgi:hypothetical protein